MQAHFMFQSHHFQLVRNTRVTRRVRHKFWHKKQTDALGARHTIRQTRQHQMTDIFNHIAVAPTDINFLAGDGIAAIAIRYSLRTQGAHIATSLRFGQVHRATPCTADQLGQVQSLDLVAGMMLQRFDLALRHQRAQLQRQTRSAHHFVNRRGHGHRQPHPTVFGAGRNGYPTALGNGAVTLYIARRTAHHTVFHNRRMLVTGPL